MMTHHAEMRAQQRGIPRYIIDLLFCYGTWKHANGAEILYFDHEAKRRLQTEYNAPNLAAIDKHLDTYLIYLRGKVVTVGHRFRRIWRK